MIDKILKDRINELRLRTDSAIGNMQINCCPMVKPIHINFQFSYWFEGYEYNLWEEFTQIYMVNELPFIYDNDWAKTYKAKLKDLVDNNVVFPFLLVINNRVIRWSDITIIKDLNYTYIRIDNIPDDVSDMANIIYFPAYGIRYGEDDDISTDENIKGMYFDRFGRLLDPKTMAPEDIDIRVEIDNPNIYLGYANATIPYDANVAFVEFPDYDIAKPLYPENVLVFNADGNFDGDALNSGYVPSKTFCNGYFPFLQVNPTAFQDGVKFICLYYTGFTDGASYIYNPDKEIDHKSFNEKYKELITYGLTTKPYVTMSSEFNFRLYREFTYETNITKAIAAIASYDYSLFADIFDKRSNVHSFTYTGKEFKALSDARDYVNYSRKHSDYISDYAIVFVNCLLYTNQVDITYTTNSINIPIVNIADSDVVEVIIFNQANNNIVETMLVNDKSEIYISEDYNLEDCDLYDTESEIMSYPNTPVNNEGRRQYELTYKYTKTKDNIYTIRFEDFSHYGKKIAIVPKKQFVYYRFLYQAGVHKILLPLSFNYCHDIARYMVFVNGRRIERDQFTVTIMNRYRPFDKLYLYVSTIIDPDDRIDIFYLPEVFTEFSNQAELATTKGDIYLDSKYPVMYPLSKKTVMLFANGKKVHPYYIQDVSMSRLRITKDLGSTHNITILEYLEGDEDIQHGLIGATVQALLKHMNKDQLDIIYANYKDGNADYMKQLLAYIYDTSSGTDRWNEAINELILEKTSTETALDELMGISETTTNLEKDYKDDYMHIRSIIYDIVYEYYLNNRNAYVGADKFVYEFETYKDNFEKDAEGNSIIELYGPVDKLLDYDLIGVPQVIFTINNRTGTAEDKHFKVECVGEAITTWFVDRSRPLGGAIVDTMINTFNLDNEVTVVITADKLVSIAYDVDDIISIKTSACYDLAEVYYIPRREDLLDRPAEGILCTNIQDKNLQKFVSDVNSMSDMSGMFYKNTKLSAIDDMYTGAATDMRYMFSNSRIKDVNINAPLAIDMTSMFEGCINILKTSIFTSTELVNISRMYNGCESLTSISDMETSSVVDMGFFVNGCTHLKAIPSFDFSKAKAFINSFNNNGEVTTVDMYGMLQDLNLFETNINGDEVRKIIGNLGDAMTLPGGYRVLTVPEAAYLELTDADLDRAEDKAWHISDAYEKAVINMVMGNTTTRVPKQLVLEISADSPDFAVEVKDGDDNLIFMSSSTHINETIEHDGDIFVNIYGNIATVNYAGTTNVEELEIFYMPSLRNIDAGPKTIQQYPDGPFTEIEHSHASTLKRFGLTGDNSIASMRGWFADCKVLNTVTRLDMNLVTDMEYMFNQCISIKYIPAISDTSKVTNMRYMFGRCSVLANTPEMDTRNVTNMYAMFVGCYKITSCYKYNTSKVTNMASMFGSCYLLNNVPLLDTSKVTNMEQLFAVCMVLEKIPELNTISCERMNSMFYKCIKLKNIPMLNTINVKTMNSMFWGCDLLTTIPLLNTSNVGDMGEMFKWCSLLTVVPQLITSKATNMNRMFENCSSLETIPLLNTANVTDMTAMLAQCTKLTNVPLLNTSKVTTMHQMFDNCVALETIPLLDTSNVTSMYRMFALCRSLDIVPALITSKVTNMVSMFSECESLETILLLDTSKAIDMSNMFYGCKSLTSIPLLNMISAEKMPMILNGTAITTIPVLNLVNVVDMKGAFGSCSALTTVPALKTPKVLSMEAMFENCNKLKTVSGLNGLACTNYSTLFRGCSALENCNISNLKSSISFEDSPKLNASSIETMLNSVQTVTSATFNITGCIGYESVYRDEIESAIVNGWTIIPDISESIIRIRINNTGMVEQKVSLTLVGSSIEILNKSSGTVIANSSINLMIPTENLGDAVILEIRGNIKTCTYDIPNMTDIAVYHMRDLISIRHANADLSTMGQYATIKSMILSGDTSITNMNRMFAGCRGLTSVLVNSSKATNTSYMFYGCNIQEIGSLDTKNVVNMEGMFSGCKKLARIPELNTVKATNMRSMFENCESMPAGIMMDTSNAIYMGNMFYGCKNLTSVPLYNTSKCIDMSYMFGNCIAITSIPLFVTTSVLYMHNMLSGCTKLTTVPLLDTVNVTNMKSMFLECESLVTIPALNTTKVTTFESMFEGCIKLTTPGITSTTSAINMNSMFKNCHVLKAVDNFVTTTVTNMVSMFYGCTALANIPTINTINVVDMSYMMFECEAITDIPAFNTVKVNNMEAMLYGCINITSLPLLETSNVVNMKEAFYKCSSLVSIPAMPVNRVTDLTSFIAHCTSLERLLITDIKASISTMGTILNKDAILVVFNNLAHTGTAKNIIVKASIYEQLSDEEKLIPGNKGWVLTYK